jgi:hypothetical protein
MAHGSRRREKWDFLRGLGMRPLDVRARVLPIALAGSQSGRLLATAPWGALARAWVRRANDPLRRDGHKRYDRSRWAVDLALDPPRN